MTIVRTPTINIGVPADDVNVLENPNEKILKTIDATPPASHGIMKKRLPYGQREKLKF